jgi:hypothetical protein
MSNNNHLNSNQTKSNSDSSSGGGIVVGVIVSAIAAGGLAYYCSKSRGLSEDKAVENAVAVGGAVINLAQLPGAEATVVSAQVQEEALENDKFISNIHNRLLDHDEYIITLNADSSRAAQEEDNSSSSSGHQLSSIDLIDVIEQQCEI